LRHRILNFATRSFLKRPGAPNIPIQAIGLSLYETLGTTTDNPVEQPGTKVTRTQWLDLSSLEMANLIGKNVLIVDEVDDTRTTLDYAVRELQKDVDEAAKKLGRAEEETKFSIFVLHNKDKAKKGHLPQSMIDGNRYLAAVTTRDVWICYPWEATYVRPLHLKESKLTTVTGILTSTMDLRQSRKGRARRKMADRIK
jgi:uncharacterized protein